MYDDVCDILEPVAVNHKGKVVEGKFIAKFSLTCPFGEKGYCQAQDRIAALTHENNRLLAKIRDLEAMLSCQVKFDN